MGHLLRRNILTYKAPPNNAGYDLICIHPDAGDKKVVRVQVKSRLATDATRGFPVKSTSLDGFDYLVAAFLNVGYYLGKARRHETKDGAKEPEFYTFPASFIRQHHNANSSWEKVSLHGLNIKRFKDEVGFEQIARALKVPYPGTE